MPIPDQLEYDRIVLQVMEDLLALPEHERTANLAARSLPLEIAAEVSSMLAAFASDDPDPIRPILPAASEICMRAYHQEQILENFPPGTRLLNKYDLREKMG